MSRKVAVFLGIALLQLGDGHTLIGNIHARQRLGALALGHAD